MRFHMSPHALLRTAAQAAVTALTASLLPGMANATTTAAPFYQYTDSKRNGAAATS